MQKATQHAGFSHAVTAQPDQQCHCSAPFTLFVIRKVGDTGGGSKKKKVRQFLEYGNLAWSRGPGPWGEASQRAGGPGGARGAWVWDWVWADLLCNVNPWGIRSCNRRGEVAVRSLGMLTLRIPPPWYTAIRKLHWRAPAREWGGGAAGPQEWREKDRRRGEKKKKNRGGDSKGQD